MTRLAPRLRSLGWLAAAACALGLGCPGERPTPYNGDGSGGSADRGGHTLDRGAADHRGLEGSTKKDSTRPCAKASFVVTETQIKFTVPKDVKYMHVKAWGAGGNGEGQCKPKDDGGLGGYSEAVFLAKAGDQLIIIVGKRGRAGLSGEDRMRFGFGDWGGGGLSGVFRGPQTITAKDRAKALIIAGGGGSAGAPGCNPGGTGNHGSAGGMSTMQGGAGKDKVNGGAGGYAGGSGGAKGKAARGGTGFVAAAALKKKLQYAQPASGSPPNTGDKDYDGKAGKTETSGRVVIHFTCALPTIK